MNCMQTDLADRAEAPAHKIGMQSEVKTSGTGSFTVQRERADMTGNRAAMSMTTLLTTRFQLMMFRSTCSIVHRSAEVE